MELPLYHSERKTEVFAFSTPLRATILGSFYKEPRWTGYINDLGYRSTPEHVPVSTFEALNLTFTPCSLLPQRAKIVRPNSQKKYIIVLGVGTFLDVTTTRLPSGYLPMKQDSSRR